MQRTGSNRVELYDGIFFTLPPAPPDREVLGNELPKKEQKWKRQVIPENFEELPKTEQKRITDQWWHWRIHGMWFFSNGVATYITGNHWFYMTVCCFDFGYPEYRDIDRRAFYMWRVCELDPFCFGLQRLKFRRLGATAQGVSINVEAATGYEEVHCGIVSKTGDDAYEAFEDAVDITYEMPAFFKPTMEGKDRPKKVMSFRAPARVMTAKNQDSTAQKKKSLKSKMNWRNTTLNAYDSRKLKRLLIDEGGKFKDLPFNEFWDVHKTCLITGRVVRGKAYVPSTVNEMTEKGGAGYKIVWDNSNPRERDANGRTKSGLYRYFNSAFDGLEGFIDEYGMSIIDDPTPEQAQWLRKQGPTEEQLKMLKDLGIEYNYKIGAKQYLLNIRDSLKNDPKGLAEHKRQFPWTPEEAFRVESKNCLFNAEKILMRLEVVESPLWNGIKPVALEWLGGIQDGTVEAVPNANGRFLISSVGVPQELRNQVKRRPDGQGGFISHPLNQGKYVIGADPYSHTTTVDGRGSDAAAYGFRLYDPTIDSGKPVHLWQTNRFIIEYIARPPSIFIFYEDMIKLCSYLGAPILFENDKPGVMYHFETRGYGAFLMNRPEVTQTSQHTRAQQMAGVPASTMTANTGANYIEAYIDTDIYGFGQSNGHCCLMDFPRQLRNLLKFEITNTTKFDPAMATIYTIVGANKHHRAPQKALDMKRYFVTYDNTGMEAVPIQPSQ
jgi:hypothetical protein